MVPAHQPSEGTADLGGIGMAFHAEYGIWIGRCRSGRTGRPALAALLQQLLQDTFTQAQHPADAPQHVRLPVVQFTVGQGQFDEQVQKQQ